MKIFDGIKFVWNETGNAAITGVLVGYVYSKFADLPVEKSVQTWAIWCAASAALSAFAEAVIKNKWGKTLAQITISTISTGVGINELEKRGLLGNKMKIFLIVSQVLFIYLQIASCTKSDKPMFII